MLNRQNGNLYILLAFVMMGVLFYSSAQTAQEQSLEPRMNQVLKNQPLKEHFSKKPITYAGKTISIEQQGYFGYVEFLLRKSAHFISYFLLGLFWFLGLKPKIQVGWLTAVVSWLSATGYAGLDEFHQMLTGGRSPMIQDIVLDSVGAITAVVIMTLFLSLRKGKKK